MKKRINKVTTVLLLSFIIAACTAPDNSNIDNSGTFVNATHQVLTFNDLGMHCADLDYSTFVILPPFNVVHSQVIERGNPPRILDSTEASVSYRAVLDGSGSINTTSRNQAGGITKTNFWDINRSTGNSYVYDLFGLDPPADEGLAFGQAMPGILNPYNSNNPQAFNRFDTAYKWFAADGIPILPIDDNGQANAYPLMRISATLLSSGQTVANLDAVLPVASEADCQNCHSLGETGASDNNPNYIFASDINDPNSVLQAAKHNILALHDDKHGTRLLNEKPVLCARCHYSAALDLEGKGPTNSLPKMSEVMHGHHGELKDVTGAPLFPTNGSLEETCYQCHPGKVTRCLRGAMGGAGIECVDCHGSMLAVGSSSREPWIDEPRCESCHTGDALNNDGAIRLSQAWSDNINIATPHLASNKRFAENKDTLYRNSLGHGGVACEACHGSTHAIWPNALPSANDNLAAVQLQGHSGTITECGSCHTSLPLTLNGPHGMHNVNSRSWNTEHEEFYERNPNACRTCHGQNLEGTVLSRTAADRDYLLDDEDDDDNEGGAQTIHVAKGTKVSCSLCHRRP
jgi:hypothetical protein